MPKGKGYTRLTHNFVRSVTTEGRYGDGRGGLGLSLLVKKTANGRWSKTWSQRIRIRGKLATLGLGSFPAVTLAMARDRVLDNARRVEGGEDIRKPPPAVPTVDEAFDRVIRDRQKSWKGRESLDQWLRAKARCKPLGSTPVSEVTPKDILDLITPMWHEKTHTARDLRSKLSIVMEWSITEGHRTATNPARPGVTGSLGKQEPVTHHKSLPPSELGSSLARIRDLDAWWAKRYCLLYIAFTGVRNGEARRATWDEIDLDTSTWTIPGSRMKAKKSHRVPLSTQAKGILAYAREHWDGNQSYIFPQERRGRPMDSKRLSDVMHRLEIPAVPHGSRSSFSNWAASKTHIPEAAAEMVLAHTPPVAVIRAYRTADFFEYRIPVMQEWANFLSETMGPVVMEPETPATDPVRVTPAPRPRPTPTPRRKTTSGATVGTAPSNVRRLALGTHGPQLSLGDTT
jgi:integrase